MSSPESGGFLIPHPSARDASTAAPASSSNTTDVLPQPRTRPLDPKSRKAESTKNYVEAALLRISGRYARRFERIGDPSGEAAQGSAESQHGEAEQSRMLSREEMEQKRVERVNGDSHGDEGYISFAETAHDLSRVVDVLWITATPSIQIPFLLSLSLSASEYLESFPFSPLATFALFTKLDAAFSQLLSFPADGASRRLTMTEKVRLRGIVEATRMRIARQASEDEWEVSRPAAEDGENTATKATQQENRDNEAPDNSGEVGKLKRKHSSHSEFGGENKRREIAASEETAAGNDITATESEDKNEGEGAGPDGERDSGLGEDESADEHTSNDSAGDEDENSGFSAWEVQVARVYEKTIVALGPLMDAQQRIADGGLDGKNERGDS